MELDAVILKVKEAIKILFERDSFLLKHNVNEKSITHKFADYLQDLFSDYNVDCEYNNNVDEEGGRKRITLLKETLDKHKLLSKSDYNSDTKFSNRGVYPDVIVHRRGTNEKNLCIVEVKKSTSTIPWTFDKLKLQAYTSSSYGNNLKYEFGLFILFNAGSSNPDYKIKLFIDGQEKSLS